jgi:uncharacterized protein involved in exopolysaccharide biosynthesis
VDRLPVGWDEGPGLVASVWRFRWLVAAVALAGALAGVGVSSVQPVMYEGSSRILLADRSSGDGGGQADPDRYVRNQAAFIMSPLVLERTVELTGGRVTVKQLRERLVAEPSKESDLITVRVRDATAKGAVELAEAVGQAYEDTAVRQAQQAVARTVARLQSDQKTIQDQLKELDARLRASRNDVALQAQRDEVARQFTLVVGRIEQARLADTAGDPVEVREQAELPEEPVQPQPMRLAAVGGLLGMVVAAGLAWWLAWRRQPTYSQPQPEWMPRAALLGAPPVAKRTRLAGPLRSRLPQRKSRDAQERPEVAPVPDARSARERARERLVTVLQSTLPEDAPMDATVALVEEAEHFNGHRPSANGNGSGHWVDRGDDQPDGNQPAASE